MEPSPYFFPVYKGRESGGGKWADLILSPVN